MNFKKETKTGKRFGKKNRRSQKYIYQYFGIKC